MSLKQIWEYLLKILNVLFVVTGLAMIAYGIYLFVAYKSSSGSSSSSSSDGQAPAPPPSGVFIQLGRPMMITVGSAHNFLDKLPKAWFIYLFIIIGIILIAIAVCGCLGTLRFGGCCLTTYLVALILLILVELAFAAFLIFDKSWKEDMPTDKTGTFDSMYRFLRKHSMIIRWVALGIIAAEVFIFVVALIEKFAKKREKRGGSGGEGEEYVAIPKHQLRQPLVNNGAGGSGENSSEDNRNDAWTTHMKEKLRLNKSSN